ncbi:unnamed protein product [Acanthoscelides obtectus]|uniref:Uncharacterized protein n=1 Tax=Acanthoscelides obtectus TaxID=200917 RepID=A0A9P0LWN2_ACAOB|nr:unnamed protein product [Acanthoscelides obtectus]CAK1649758.1 hypothetical protein AOBTE_LOCUS16407 [Acanthoscelides obtectus]
MFIQSPFLLLPERSFYYTRDCASHRPSHMEEITT